MKKATLLGVATTTVFYMLCGCMGYAAFGDNAPGNLLTGFGFYNPFWLIDIANAAIVIHLVGAYQVSITVSVSIDLTGSQNIIELVKLLTMELVHITSVYIIKF